MRPRDLPDKKRHDARTSVAMVMLLAAGLAGCAANLVPRPVPAAPYTGEFTGEFVDGKPLYRFPTIEVVGSRRSVGPGS